MDEPKRYDSRGFELISPLEYLESLIDEDESFGDPDPWAPSIEEVQWWEKLHPPDRTNMKEGPSSDE
jgi:hypothetical protein